MQYSTLSDYFDAVAAEEVAWSTWPAKDWFPYYDFEASWWTGYFTSRSALKGFIRSREAIQRSAEILHVLSTSPVGPRAQAGDFMPLETIRHANGEGTHHDAVTGSSDPQG